MKGIFAPFILLALTFVLGCNKDEPTAISYPGTGSYGENILALPGTTLLNSIDGYSMTAELGKKAELKVIITKLSGTGLWYVSAENGWKVNNINGSSQEFSSNTDGLLDLDITFENGPGSCRVDFYENSSSITAAKTFTW